MPYELPDELVAVMAWAMVFPLGDSGPKQKKNHALWYDDTVRSGAKMDVGCIMLLCMLSVASTQLLLYAITFVQNQWDRYQNRHAHAWVDWEKGSQKPKEIPIKEKKSFGHCQCQIRGTLQFTILAPRTIRNDSLKYSYFLNVFVNDSSSCGSATPPGSQLLPSSPLFYLSFIEFIACRT